MKTKIAILIAALFIVLFILLLGNRKKSTKGAIPSNGNDRPAPAPLLQTSREEISLSPQHSLLIAAEQVATSETAGNQLKRILETPVEIYGQVLDQFNMPVVGAEIVFYIHPRGPMTKIGTVRSNGPDGNFEIRGINAAAINISIKEMAGYQRGPKSEEDLRICRSLEELKLTEEYKELAPEAKAMIDHPEFWAMFTRDTFTEYKPDKSNPVIFRLEKL